MGTNRLSIVIVLLVVIFQSCETKNSSQESPSNDGEFDKPSSKTYSYELKKISEKLETCNDGECTHIEVNYPVMNADTDHYNAINNTIESHLKTLLSDYIMDADGNEEIQALTEMFLQSYEKFQQSFPESLIPWYIECDVMLSATTADYISLAFNISSYTGGAHSNTLIDYVNLSPKGEKINDLSFFFKDIDQLRKLAEDQFRTKYGIDPGEPLSQKGFIFDDDQFSLTQNFGFTESAVIFYYNSYDIGPYAKGPTALLIPLINLRDNYRFSSRI